jgi:hypothetical protein
VLIILARRRQATQSLVLRQADTDTSSNIDKGYTEYRLSALGSSSFGVVAVQHSAPPQSIVDQPSTAASDAWPSWLLYVIIGGGALCCCCIVALVAFVVLRQRRDRDDSSNAYSGTQLAPVSSSLPSGKYCVCFV